MNIIDIITDTDSYKFGHWPQYPEGTEVVSSYFESRVGALYNKTVFFGLQYYLMKYMQGSVVWKGNIEEASELSAVHFGNPAIFNRAMWEHIAYRCNGMLPVRIKAVPEGTPVTVSNVLMTIENTDPDCAALTNHLETKLSRLWAPSTTGTLSYEVMIMLKHYWGKTCDGMDGIKFGLHDFGSRGVSSLESAAIQGAAHLLNFMGTDTIPALQLAHNYYAAPYEGLGYSVVATEHSVMTSYGPEGEDIIMGRLLDQNPTGILSIVIDSYDYRNFISGVAARVKDRILGREGKVVFRPDSGDPQSTTLDVLNRLEAVFGTTKNSKGYKVLNPKVGMLWGDGIDYQGIRSILYTMESNGWAASNIVFGAGGGLLQKMNRDTQRFAFKCCAQKRNGEWIDISKRPLDTSKVSKKGRLALVKGLDGHLETVPWVDGIDDQLETVFENGEIKKFYTFDQCRKNTGLWG